MGYVNLHGHSHYSLLDGFGSPAAIAKRAKELGYPAVALTDHGVMHGLIELHKAAKAEGIRPVLGCELYVAKRSRFDKEAKVDIKPYHLTTLAETTEGYENLLKLTTQAHLEGFYYKPRVDYKLLKAHSKGLIALSGCLAARIPRAILSGNEDEIKEAMDVHIDIFGKENFFLEMQDHPLIEQQGTVNDRLKKLAKEYGLGLVVTCDSHYPKPEDTDVHDLLLCIQTGTNVNEENRMRYTGDFSLREEKDLAIAFEDCPEALENTVKIAERCNVEFDFGTPLIPSFNTPQNEKADIYLRTLCAEGLAAHFPDGLPEGYQERLDFELETVHSMGFDTYFLIVHDFVKFAKEEKITVGPGRGSAAGSIIAWSLGITDLDPIDHGLFFERFLNPERVSMPDIDIDFADHRRDEVLQYVVKKYGRSNVAQIITFGTMAPKAAIRDAGRALGYPYAEVDVLSKAVPPPVLGKYSPLVESIVDDPQLSDIYKKDERAKVLLDYAKRLEGTVRHSGTHACAVVISEKPLDSYTALQYAAGSKAKDAGDQEIVTQYSANPLEDLGLLKMDFLGLRNLTVIERTEEFVKKIRGEDVTVNELALDDKLTYELLQRGDTTGVFQLESGGMRRYLKELKPTEFGDIVAMGALYRPGPMEWIPDYIKGKHDPKSVKYLDESFKEILAPTYGVAVYQEQILQLARDFAGFSLGEADILRKAVGKKIPQLLAEQREKFVEGAVAEGHKKKFAEEVFAKVIEPFAGYGFNKAHAACYGMIAYQTAYLKAHYPIEFMTALLCSDATNMDRVVLEIKECTEMDIDVLPPSVNESFSNFAVVDDKTIRFGLLAIKGVGDGPIAQIIEAREKGGKFKSIEDMAKRVPAQIMNKKLIQALACSGALDEFGERNQIAESYGEISKFAKAAQESAVDGQASIFGLLTEEVEIDKLKMLIVPKATDMEKLRLEKELLGLYVSGHPLRGMRSYLQRKAGLIGKFTKKHLDKPVKAVGAVSGLRKIMTKAGKYMATFFVEDPSGKVAVVIFPRPYVQYENEIVEDQMVCVTGKLDNKRGSCQILCDSAKRLSLETMIANAKEAGSFDENDKSFASRLLDDIWADDESEEEVVAEVTDEIIEEPVVDAAANELYRIDVPATIAPDRMKSLKSLLESNKGETAVELYLASANKKIKLPFGVDLNAELKAGIEKLLV